MRGGPPQNRSCCSAPGRRIVTPHVFSLRVDYSILHGLAASSSRMAHFRNKLLIL